MSVALRLADDIDVGRGSTIVRTQNQPTVSNRFEALLCWMSEQPAGPPPALPGQAHDAHGDGRRRSTSATASTSRRCTATRRATTLELNDLGRVHLELSSPLVFDSYRRNRLTGSLIVIDEATNETVAAGVILDTEVDELADRRRRRERSPNVRWQGSRMTRERRWRRSGTAARRCGSRACPARASRRSPRRSRSG